MHEPCFREMTLADFEALLPKPLSSSNWLDPCLIIPFVGSGKARVGEEHVDPSDVAVLAESSNSNLILGKENEEPENYKAHVKHDAHESSVSVRRSLKLANGNGTGEEHCEQDMQEVILQREEQPVVIELDPGNGDAVVLPGCKQNSDTSLHWLLGERGRFVLTSERPNKKRKLLGADAGLERLVWLPPLPGETGSRCDVCCLGETDTASNRMLRCNSCEVSVHQKCYGVQVMPDGYWLCAWCDSISLSRSLTLNDEGRIVSMPCVLCPKDKGALKPVKCEPGRTADWGNLSFAHLFCSLWAPEVFVQDTDSMEPVTSIGDIPENRTKMVCTLCKVMHGACVRCSHGTDEASFPHRKITREERLLGGLLVEGFDQESCHSRYQSAVYRRNPGRKPSQYLVSKLRSQEALQRRCGPGTAAYANALEQLKSSKSVASPECKYVVSISYRGLGNRIIAAASEFLYALLTDRVFLVDPSTSVDELFCEPFPNTSWLLPPGFPLGYVGFYYSTPERYGKMREDGVLRTDAMNGSAASGDLPAFAYIHLDWNQTDHDKLFFCDDDQRLLSNIQWLLIRSDSYIAPGLFLVEAFQEELDRLFPERDAVFHHLGRYLFHPTNGVWGLIKRYYDAHFASAQRVVGIQVRVFPWRSESPGILKQIKTCTQNERLLPAVLGEQEEEPLEKTTTSPAGVKPTAVLITSLKAWYYDNMKAMYWERATANGEVVVFDQPSHEEEQRFGVKSHEHKAWAEMYLLSMADTLVTTADSTFGYVAQGLGGMRPWILDMGMPNSTVGWPCSRDMSMEPCFHIAPTNDCKRREDAGKIVPHVRHCKDRPTGLKLV